MSNSRREFLKATAAVVGTMAGTAGSRAGERDFTAGANPDSEQGPTPPEPLLRGLVPASRIQVPKMKFGNVEISRLVIGCNPFYGWGHFNRTLGTVMKEWYTQDKVCEVLHQCNRYGINAYNYLHTGRAPLDFQRFQSEGGQMHLIAQGTADPELVVKDMKPVAIYHHGEMTDRAFREGKKETVREYCKKLRQLGVMVGVGSHKPEIIATVEDEGWDVDFYAGCVYNRTRTPDEIRKMLNGELPIPPGEVYLESDPPRMYKILRQIRKPCFAFKVLAAGRIEQSEALDTAYRIAFSSMKPSDGVFVGIFPRIKDEVRDNAERVHRILAGGV